MFASPHCGYCVRAAPDFEKAAIRLKPMVDVIGVDCSTAPSACQGIKGKLCVYPARIPHN